MTRQGGARPDRPRDPATPVQAEAQHPAEGWHHCHWGDPPPGLLPFPRLEAQSDLPGFPLRPLEVRREQAARGMAPASGHPLMSLCSHRPPVVTAANPARAGVKSRLTPLYHGPTGSPGAAAGLECPPRRGRSAMHPGPPRLPCAFGCGPPRRHRETASAPSGGTPGRCAQKVMERGSSSRRDTPRPSRSLWCVFPGRGGTMHWPG